ncbi:MAG: T9SS type A sorting domain-containing protein [Bacteroidetes bacterium]|nr:T9SS type A sorting domain-containing protein [Bacteroidota bacterium]
MKKLINIIILFFLSVSFLSAQIETQPESSTAAHIFTPHGIVFTDDNHYTLFLEHNGTIEELVSAPGAGYYFTVSPDRNTIGFKYIFDDNLQSPALLDLTTKNITYLHSPSPRAGQVRFSKNGTIVYTVEEEAYIQKGKTTRKVHLGTYSNIVDLSPDDNFLSYNNDDDQIILLNLSSLEKKQISAQSSFFPQWSPAGNKLAYSSLDGKLFVFDAQSEQTASLGEGLNPVWMNDGGSLIAERRETEKHELLNSDLYQLSVDGKQTKRLTKTKNLFETEPSVTSAGEIIFHAHNGEAVLKLMKDGSVKTVSVLQTEKVAAAKKSKKTSGLKKTASPQAYFEMPYTNQVYDTPDWYNGSAACGPTTAIMVLAYYGILPEWKVWISANKPSPGHYSAYGNYICEKYRFRGISYIQIAEDPNGKQSWGGYGFMWSTGSPFTRMGSYYKNHGLTALRQGTDSDGGGAPSNDFIVNEVTNLRPYSLCNGLTTAGHIIAINGIGTEKHTLITNDPYGNKNISYPSTNGRVAQYDWPGYNNGYKNLNNIWWGISVSAPQTATADTLVDDLNFLKGFSMSNTGTATMYSWNDMNSGYNGHLWYVKTKQSDTCFAVWKPSLQKDGMYEVSAFIQASNAKAARYTINHKNGTSIVVVDQSQVKADWLSLGVFPFEKNSNSYVKLGDGSDSTGQEIVFDAIRWTYQAPLSVERNNHTAIPTTMQLKQNYPNPFNPSTTIMFSVPENLSGKTVSLRVYNILGEEISTLVNQFLSAGEYSVVFNAEGLASGLYFYRLQAGNTILTQRMNLIK